MLNHWTTNGGARKQGPRTRRTSPALKNPAVLFLHYDYLTWSICPTCPTMPHPAFFLTKTLLTRTSLKFSHQPLRPIIHSSIKHFSTSQAAMAIKTYFDVSWQGPVLDNHGRPTKEIKGKINCPTFANIRLLLIAIPLTASQFLSLC